MGGFKQSGIGREFGPEAIDSYVETQSIGIPPSLADSLS
jgi:acyl-CoA reductase-like NAD-dependent aldehyde dehydrogenase